ncbi:MAG: DUF4272 domain-containing protein, partial [Saprospiraceae bacterium]|nr:DUF4272 domain-containing protein [Saprospiraceae bacterium]
MKHDLMERKNRLEERLERHGITTKIPFLPYLDFDEQSFVSSYEAGCRMMILYALSYTASEFADRELVAIWLKREKLWGRMSPSEKKLFEDDDVYEESLFA